MLNALLVQLFGREVIDRLSLAGFDSSEAIAGAGAERLAEEGGIALALARRIVAVAMEEPREADLEHFTDSVAEPIAIAFADAIPDVEVIPDVDAIPDAEVTPDAAPLADTAPLGVEAPVMSPVAEPSTGAGIEVAMEAVTPPPSETLPQPEAVAPAEPFVPVETPSSSEGTAPAEPADRHVRRPFRRPHSTLASAVPSAAKSRARGKDRAAKRKEAPRAPAPDPDPFVDEVGLVSWMGSAARGVSAPAAAFAVADEILDPGPPRLPPDRPEPLTAAPSPPAKPSRPPEATEPPASPVAPVSGSRSRGPMLVEGSFWSFGSLPDRAPGGRTTGEAGERRPRSGAADDSARETSGGASSTPRRRSQDGH
jgi:hypothetical protein